LAAWKTLLLGSGAPASPTADAAPAQATAAFPALPEPELEGPEGTSPPAKAGVALGLQDQAMASTTQQVVQQLVIMAQQVVITVARHGTHDLWLPPAHISTVMSNMVQGVVQALIPSGGVDPWAHHAGGSRGFWTPLQFSLNPLHPPLTP
jgi:hypothetical protein